MDKAYINNQLKQLIEKNTGALISDADENLQASGKMDSYALVMVVLYIEDFFKVKIDLESIDFEKINTLNSFSDLVLQELNLEKP